MQLWSTRGDDPLAVQLAILREQGFTDVQPYHGQYEDVAGLKVALEEFGMSARSGHFKFSMFDGDASPVIDAARVLGMDLVVAPWLDPDERPADVAGWQRLHERLLHIKTLLLAEGLRFAWHNHDFEFAMLPDGSRGIEHLLGEDIDFAMDIAWIAKAGLDPLPWLERYAGRIPVVHVKDVAADGCNEEQMGFADVGHGTMDWPALWAALDRLEVPLRIAEHDMPCDWRRFAIRSAASLKKLRGDLWGASIYCP